MIKELRDTLAADLAPLDITVHSGWPDRITPPAAIVVPPASGSYVTGGPSFGHTYTVAVDVMVLVSRASASLALEALETLIEGVLVNSADWALTGVDAPSLVTVNGAELLGTLIHLNKSPQLT